MLYSNSFRNWALASALSLFTIATKGQVTISPASFDQNTSVTIQFDASVADPEGSAGLVGASKVYMHVGAMMISPRSDDWTYVVGNWGADDGVGEMTNVGGNVWEITITPSSYFGIAGGENIYRLGMVFRDAAGNNVGKNQDGSGNIYLRVAGAVQDREVDSLSLVDLYNFTNGGSWTDGTNWKVTPMDTWTGVTVTAGRVTNLALSNNNLRGRIPSSIGDMNALVSVDLSINQLSGDVPLNIQMLGNSLQELFLDDNQLTGLPDLTFLSSLTLVSVSNNYLDFADLEPNVGGVFGISYIPQIEYGTSQLRGIFDGQTITVSTDPGGTSNTYQWYKDGIIMTDSTNQTLQILGTNIATEAIFHCEVTSTIVTGVTLTSAPIIVQKSTSTDPTDSLALVALYNSTNGDNWKNNANWLKDPVDVWFGVKATAGRVDTLVLFNNGLSGTLPPEIGNLTSLSQLGLYNNQNISGTLPTTLGNLVNLKTLYLLGNKFEGSIPAELANCVLMEDFEIHANNFSGPITDIFASWSNLRIFAIGDNQFEGAVPSSLAGLPSFVELYVPNCNFTELPDFSGIATWDGFDVSNNYFTFEDLEANSGILGSVYYAVFPQKEIPLGGNQILFTGDALNLDASIGGSVNIYEWFKNGISTGITTPTYNIPSVVAVDEGSYQAKIISSFFPGDTLFTENTAIYIASTLRMADSLVLVEMYNTMGGQYWNNQNNWLVDGTTLESWGGIIMNGDRVYEIILTDNNISGSLPQSIEKLDALHNLNLNRNLISGSIPNELYGLTSLQYIYLSENSLSGDISSGLGNLINLKHLYIGWNSLTGTIPTSFQNLTILEQIGLTGNQLTGNIPTELFSSPFLISVYLDANQLTGEVPDLTGLDNLRHFKINQNNLSGVFPENNWQLPSLEVLQIGYNNSLHIILPANLGSLTNLTELNISRTVPIRGAFPVEVFNLINLVNLEMGGHYFTGTIGPEIGNLTNLQWLWIWDNLLEGDFPNEITNLTNLIGFGIAGNQFTSFPDISGFPNLQYLELAWNQLGFKDLLPYTSLELSNFRYDNQQRKPSQHLTIAQNGSVSLSNPLDAANNEYQWLFNLDTLSSETNKDLTISNAQTSNLGGYFAWVTNPALTDLIIATPYYNVAFEGAPKAFYVDNRPGALTDFTSFYAGFYGTNDGDTLYVAGSDIPYNIGGMRLETPKVIIGPGYFLDINTETQFNTPSAKIQQYFHIAPGAEGSVIYGLEFDHANNGNRLDFHNDFSTSPRILSNVKLIGNKIHRLNFSHTASNIELAGNYINQFFFNSTSLDRTLWRTYDDFNIHNNIIDSIGIIFARISADHNSLSNINFINNTINYVSDSIQNITLSSNIIATNMSQGSSEISNLVGDYSTGVFENATGTFTIDSDFNLSTTSSAIGAGEGGINAGHTGGDAPYVLSGLPPVPNIYDIVPQSRIRFDVKAKQNANTTTNINKLNYWVSNNGVEVDKGRITLEEVGVDVVKIFRPKLSKVDPGASYDLYLQAKSIDGKKGLRQHINFEATTVNASGSITTSAGSNVEAGKVYLFEVNAEGNAFDTLSTSLSAGAFTFNNIVEGDYLAMAFADTIQYPNQLPTYFERTTFWEESDTLLIDQNFPNFGIQLVAEPEVNTGTGKITGVIEEEFDENEEGGRIEAKRRVAGAGVSVSRKVKQGRTEEDEYELVDYVYSNENGDFTIKGLDDDEYVINIQYPGYPMDKTSNINIILGAGGGDNAEVTAVVKEGKISVTIVEITGVERLDAFETLRFYPNPSSDFVYISGLQNQTEANIIITDMRGVEVVRTKNWQSGIDIKSLQNGVYLINAYGRENKDTGVRARLVINK